jgi:hypothetical protein
MLSSPNEKKARYIIQIIQVHGGMKRHDYFSKSMPVEDKGKKQETKLPRGMSREKCLNL